MNTARTFAVLLPWKLTGTGGVDQVVLNLLNHCDNSRLFRPLLIQNDWPSTRAVYEEQAGFPAVRVRIESMCDWDGTPGSILRFAARFPFTAIRMRSLVQRHKIAAINAHFPDLAAATLLLLRRLKLIDVRIILSVHGSDVRNVLKSTGRARSLFRWMLREADHVVSCSKGLMEEVEMLEPAVKARRVIYNGIDSRPFVAQPAALREPETELIVSVGKFDHRKGHDLLVNAFRQLARQRPSLRLWIVGGEGSQLEELRRSVEGDSRIRLFVNMPHEQVMPTVAQANVFALASRWVKGQHGEGHPICLLEAGSIGVPIVSSRSCGVEEMITEGVHGSLVELENSAQLATALRHALDNPAKARTMAETFRHHVTANLTWARAWRQYEELAAAGSPLATFDTQLATLDTQLAAMGTPYAPREQESQTVATARR